MYIVYNYKIPSVHFDFNFQIFHSVCPHLKTDVVELNLDLFHFALFHYLFKPYILIFYLVHVLY